MYRSSTKLENFGSLNLTLIYFSVRTALQKKFVVKISEILIMKLVLLDSWCR